MKRAAACLVALALLSGPGGAAGRADPQRAAAAPWSEAQLTERVAALSDRETALAALRERYFAAEDAEQAIRRDLRYRRDEIARLLVALQAFGRTDRPDALPHPAGPLAAARARLMRAALRPQMQAGADALAAELRAVAAAQSQQADQLALIEATLETLAAERAALRALLDERPAASAEAQVPAALLREAESLSDLAAALAASGAEAGEPPPALAAPVVGAVRRGFRARDGAGVRRPGLVLDALPQGVVRAPAAGIVRYAGPYLDYGYVVVIEPRRDLLILLAGLATLDTATGARVETGALLGQIGGRPPTAQEYLMLGHQQGGETPPETLYMELRHGRDPIDPSPWLAAHNG